MQMLLNEIPNSPQPLQRRRFWQRAQASLRLQRPMPNWWFGVRLVAMLVLSRAVYQLGYPFSAAPLVIVALYSQMMIDLPLPLPALLRRAALGLVLFMLIVLCCAAARVSPLLGAALLFGWSVASALAAAHTPALGAVFNRCLLIFMVLAPFGLAPDSTLVADLLSTAAGALIGFGVGFSPWLLRRDSPARAKVAACFHPSARYDAVLAAREYLAEDRPRPHLAALTELAGQIMTLRLVLRRQVSRRGAGDPALLSAASAFANALDVALHTLEVALERRQERAGLGPIHGALAALEGLPSHALVATTARQIVRLLEESSAIVERRVEATAAPPNRPLPSVSQTLRSNLCLRSVYLRWGIRLGLALAVVYYAYALTGSHNAFWVALPIILTMRSPYAAANEQLWVNRVAGTFVGILLVGLVDSLVREPESRQLVVLAALFCMGLFSGGHYGVQVVFITLFAVTSVLAPHESPWGWALSRMVDQTLGVAFAMLLSYLVLPVRSQLDLPQKLAELLRSLAAALRAGLAQTPDPAALRAALGAAILACDNFEALGASLPQTFVNADQDAALFRSLARQGKALLADTSAAVIALGLAASREPYAPLGQRLAQDLGELAAAIEHARSPRELPAAIRHQLGERADAPVAQPLHELAVGVSELHGGVREALALRRLERYAGV